VRIWHSTLALDALHVAVCVLTWLRRIQHPSQSDAPTINAVVCEQDDECSGSGNNFYFVVALSELCAIPAIAR
jgi:hypothetical protein